MVGKIWGLFQVFIRQFFGNVIETPVVQIQKAAAIAVTFPWYMAGYEKRADGIDKTFCNVFARKFLTGSLGTDLYEDSVPAGFEFLNYNLSCVAPHGIRELYYNTSIPRMMQLCNAAVRRGALLEVAKEDVIDYALSGEVVFGICDLDGWNHEFLVYPEKDSTEIRIFQQGKYPLCNEPISHKYCFGENWESRLEGHIRFFIFPRKEG